MAPVSRMAHRPNGRMAAGRPAQARSLNVSEQLSECIDEWPLTSLCAAFGGGLIAGVGLVALYCQMEHSQSTTQSWASSAEALAQRVSDSVRSALSQHLPNFHS
jgi:hypothetical protein